MWKYEWKKLWKNRVIVWMLFGCFVLNGAALLWNAHQFDEERRCFPQDLHQVYEELAPLEEMEKIPYLLQELEKVESTKDLEGEKTYLRRGALNTVLFSVQETQNYAGYLQEMEQQAKRLSQSALFADKDSYSKRNAEKIPERYAHLKNIVPKATDSTGLLLATESKMTDGIAMAIVLVLAFSFFTMEREEGTMSFVRSVRYGGKTLGVQKIVATLSGGVIGVFLLYLQNFLIMGIRFGLGNVTEWIQSLEGFLASPWKIKIIDYIVLLFIGKMLAVLVVSMVIVFLCLRGKTILQTVAMLLGVGVIEYACYVGIVSNSWLSIWKRCNLFSLMNVEKFFETYENVNLFGYPVSSVLLCTLFGTGVFLLCLLGSVKSYEKVSRMEYAQKKGRKFFKKHTRAHTLIGYEMKKLLFVNGVGVVMLLFLVGQTFYLQNTKTYFSLDELYYKKYLQEMSGPVTSEKMTWLEMEERRIRDLEKKEPSPEVERQLLCKPAFEQIKNQAERIGEQGVFLDEIGFSYLLDRKNFLVRVGITCGMTLLAFFNMFMMETLSGMHTLWNTVPNGRRRIWIRKWGVAIGIICVFTVCSEGLFLWHEIKEQSLTGCAEQIRYLWGYENYGRVTIQMYCFIRGIIRILAGIGTLGVIASVSKKVKNGATVLLVAGGILGSVYIALFAWII